MMVEQPSRPAAAHSDGAEPLRQYEALTQTAVYYVRTDRGLLRIIGRDRSTWLHNLTTNQIKPLKTGEGNYAFALNLQGRIVFDANVFMEPDAILLDLDRGFVESAKRHLAKYAVVEDVAIEDESDRFGRIAVAGPQAACVFSLFGAVGPGSISLPGLVDLSYQGTRVRVLRTDFCGEFTLDVLIPCDTMALAAELFAIQGRGMVVPVGEEIIRIRRIEAGIPWPVHEITENVLPAETRQLSRAVSFNKGCYLGQEVVERMRSRGVVARQLVGFEIEGDELPPRGADVEGPEGKPAGSLTSVCPSMGLGRTIGLGYVRTVYTTAGTSVRINGNDRTWNAKVVELPFVADGARSIAVSE